MGRSMRDYILTCSRFYGFTGRTFGSSGFSTEEAWISAPAVPHCGCLFPGSNIKHLAITWGVGIAQWLERRTRDWKVAGSSPCRSGEIKKSPGSTFCADSLNALAGKRSRSFCQKCRWQVTVKHTCTLRMWLCMKWHGEWVVWCTQNAPRRQQFHVAPAKPAL